MVSELSIACVGRFVWWALRWLWESGRCDGGGPGELHDCRREKPTCSHFHCQTKKSKDRKTHREKKEMEKEKKHKREKKESGKEGHRATGSVFCALCSTRIHLEQRENSWVGG